MQHLTISRRRDLARYTSPRRSVTPPPDDGLCGSEQMEAYSAESARDQRSAQESIGALVVYVAIIVVALALASKYGEAFRLWVVG